MIKIEKLNPFGRMCISLGMLPSSYKESLTYEEQLLWFFKYLDETVIPTVNNNADAVEELQALYLQIKTYVDEYFNNLDVQEEINNKLDDMAESGQLTDIIAQYLQLAGVLAYNTVADMKAANNLVDGSICKTLGYHSINDGGDAYYKVREVINTDVVDEMTLIALSDEELIAELIILYPINPLTLGAKGDGTTDDYNYLQKAINLGSVKLTKGSYYISNTLNMLSTSIFDGNNRPIIPAANKTAFQLIGNGVNNPITNTVMKNINIMTSENAGSNGIYLKDGYFNYFENINIQTLNGDNTFGIKIENGFNHVFRNGRILGDLTFTGQIGFDVVLSLRCCGWCVLLSQGQYAAR